RPARLPAPPRRRHRRRPPRRTNRLASAALAASFPRRNGEDGTRPLKEEHVANVPEALGLAATTIAGTVVAIAGVAATTGPVDLAPIPLTFGVRAAGVVFLGLVAVGAAVGLRALRNAVVEQLNHDADRIAELAGLGRL